MWFKNALIYRITKPLDWLIDTLAPQLEQHRYQPCAQSDILKFGWSTPLKGSESLYFAVGKQILLLAQKEEKMLPAHVIKRELDARVEKIEPQVKESGKTNFKRRRDCYVIAARF